jgi:nucleotide-binding universal stress UspA family protein
MTMTKILVGTDTSARAELAVEEAAGMARAEGAELVVLYVRPARAAREAIDSEKAPDPASYLARIRGRLGDVRTRIRTEDGDAADGIVRAAVDEHADLIVVGNRGIDRPRRGFLRSVPARVVNRAPCSVFIVDTRAVA